jgi:hypothetical protein
MAVNMTGAAACRGTGIARGRLRELKRGRTVYPLTVYPLITPAIVLSLGFTMTTLWFTIAKS